MEGSGSWINGIDFDLSASGPFLYFRHGSRFQVHGSQLNEKLIQGFQPRTLNRERRTLIPYVVYDFRSIMNAAELLPKIEPGRFPSSLVSEAIWPSFHAWLK